MRKMLQLSFVLVSTLAICACATSGPVIVRPPLEGTAPPVPKELPKQIGTERKALETFFDT